MFKILSEPILVESNIKDVDNGIDKNATKNNLIFIFTSTQNQKEIKMKKILIWI